MDVAPIWAVRDVQVMPFAEVASHPLVPTATNIPSFCDHMISLMVAVDPIVRDVHVTPSLDVAVVAVPLPAIT
jgi:hypothetical protein